MYTLFNVKHQQHQKCITAQKDSVGIIIIIPKALTYCIGLCCVGKNV